MPDRCKLDNMPTTSVGMALKQPMVETRPFCPVACDRRVGTRRTCRGY